jgi:hypothetical protein
MSKARSGIGDILSARGAQRARNKMSRSHLWIDTAGAPGFASFKVAITSSVKAKVMSLTDDTNPVDLQQCSEFEH